MDAPFHLFSMSVPMRYSPIVPSISAHGPDPPKIGDLLAAGLNRASKFRAVRDSKVSLTMTVSGHSGRFRDVRIMSALHPISDMTADIAGQRFVPLATTPGTPLHVGHVP
jgi:hypothetical protein